MTAWPLALAAVTLASTLALGAARSPLALTAAALAIAGCAAAWCGLLAIA